MAKVINHKYGPKRIDKHLGEHAIIVKLMLFNLSHSCITRQVSVSRPTVQGFTKVWTNTKHIPSMSIGIMSPLSYRGTLANVCFVELLLLEATEIIICFQSFLRAKHYLIYLKFSSCLTSLIISLAMIYDRKKSHFFINLLLRLFITLGYITIRSVHSVENAQIFDQT